MWVSWLIQLVYQAFVAYLAALMLVNLFRENRLGDQVLTAALLIPFLLRAFWVK